MTPTQIEHMLTGRARVRPSWRGRQILQVEISAQRYSQCPPPPGRQYDAAWREFTRLGAPMVEWRDATWQDVHALPGFIVGWPTGD